MLTVDGAIADYLDGLAIPQKAKREKLAQHIKGVCEQLDGLSESDIKVVLNVIEKLKENYCCFKVSD